MKRGADRKLRYENRIFGWPTNNAWDSQISGRAVPVDTPTHQRGLLGKLTDSKNSCLMYCIIVLGA